jgi:hypothetical protein
VRIINIRRGLGDNAKKLDTWNPLFTDPPNDSGTGGYGEKPLQLAK